MTRQFPSFKPAPFFVFRTALLPWQAFQAEGREALGEKSCEGSWGHRLVRRDALAEWIQRPEILEAIFLASPDLVNAIPFWIKAPDSEKGSRCERSLMKYFSRMCGRSTPFGLFAGCSVGSLGSSTSLRVEGRDRYRRHTRLDMDYLCSLAEALAGQEGVRDELAYRPNSSLYRSGDRVLFVKANMNRKTRSYQLVAATSTPYLLDTIRRAKRGASLHQLAAELVDAEITHDEAHNYLLDLVASQILLPDIQPRVTGEEPVFSMIDQLKSVPGGERASSILAAASRLLAEIDSNGLGQGIEPYIKVAEGLRELPCEVELSRLFQVDLFKPSSSATLGPEIIREAGKAVDLLRGLPMRGSSESLIRFQEAFLARYESREVPLTEALDEDSGIGFASISAVSAESSPLLEGIVFPGEPGQISSEWSPFHSFLLQKVQESGGSDILNIAPEAFKPFESKDPFPLPKTFSVVCRVASKSSAELAVGNFKLSVSSVSGPSGATLLGRFCHGDPVLEGHVRDLINSEKGDHPDSVLAEIVHLPEGRIGNVILRPTLREYEIPFLGQSGAAEDQQIPITDLMVSVRGGRIVLRSQRLEKEVLPRLTNAHNYTFRSLGTYRFLCLLQHQGAAGGLGWHWGPLDALPFLPRVEVGRLVLAKARWRIERAEVNGMIKGVEEDRDPELNAWMTLRRLPRFCLLVDGDNKLPVDFENPLSVDALLDLVKSRERFTLEEMFPGPDELLAEGPEGKFVHELVIPFINEQPAGEMTTNAPTRSSLPRTFLPGSEWLFAKIYAGVGSIDRLLYTDLGPLISRFHGEGRIDQWFFLRYGDPDWHLRLRVHGNPTFLMGTMLPSLASECDRLIGQGIIRKVALDTYDRELERYGGDSGMEISEKIFHVDSQTVLEILDHYRGDAGADARWRLCLRGMDDLLSVLQFDAPEKLRVLSTLRSSFLLEFRDEGALAHQLGAKYRKEKARLGVALGAGARDPDLEPGLLILEKRRRALEPLGRRISDLSSTGLLDAEGLAGSYLHMHANRLLRSAQRAQETVLYDFLARHYESLIARTRTGAEEGSPAGRRG